MNNEQIKSSVRWVLATFGGVVAGWGAHSGWFTSDQILSVLNSETAIGLVTTGIGLVWGLITHTQANSVAVVTAMASDPAVPVKAVVFEPGVAGRDLAKTVASATGSAAGIVVAGTPAARTAAAHVEGTRVELPN